MESLKDLIAKVPNLRELLDEAEKPPVTVVAETAYIYNGYGLDVILTHLGFDYKVPAGEVLTVEGMPDYKEVDPQRSRPGAIEWYNLPMKGEFIAHELVNKHGFDVHGLAVFTELEDGTVPSGIKSVADEAGKMYWKFRIEQFKVNRSKAQAGIAGYKINPDPNLYKMLALYSPDDAHFVQHSQARADQMAEDNAKTNRDLASALTMIAKALGKKTVEVEPLSDAVVPVVEPPTLAERASLVGVRRMPHEKDAVFEARVRNAEELAAEKVALAAQVASQTPEPTVG